jgi:hypothetical protein
MQGIPASGCKRPNGDMTAKACTETEQNSLNVTVFLTRGLNLTGIFAECI